MPLALSDRGRYRLGEKNRCEFCENGPWLDLNCRFTLESLRLRFQSSSFLWTHSPLLPVAESSEQALNPPPCYLSNTPSSPHLHCPPCESQPVSGPLSSLCTTLFAVPLSFPRPPPYLNHTIPPFSPLWSLDADHAHVLRVVRQLAAEALVLKNRLNVVPIVFGDAASDSQVVRITWGRGERKKQGVSGGIKI